MNVWELPDSVEAGGKKWKIRTDFRNVLTIFKFFDSPEYEDDEKWEICLSLLYEDYDIDRMPPAYVKEALMNDAVSFFNMGMPEDKTTHARLMDWEQDAPIMAAPMSAQLGRDIRDPAPLHWWRFLSAYYGIGESLFAEVLSIRQKKAKGKKLEKYEQEFYRANKALIDLKPKEQRSNDEKEELRKLFGFKRKK